MCRVWQIGTGSFGRDFSPLFLAHDLMFLGPGEHGPYDRETYRRLAADGRETSLKVGLVGAFAFKMQPGDVVLLRKAKQVAAVGLVHEEGYLHDPTFDDIYGWDLSHTRRVAWQGHLAKELETIQAGGGLFSARKQIPVFTRVNDEEVVTRIKPLFSECRARPLKARPDATPEPLTLEQLGQELFARGLANSAVDQVQRAIERQRRLLGWYRGYGKVSARPDEHEVVAHMVLPLLLALAWSEQLLAVEWYRVDLAAFSGTPTTRENCVLICEAKGLWHGLQNVLQQAEQYVTRLDLDECRQILLTQGGRFYLHRRNPNGSWPEEPTGYLNVERIRTNHIAPANTDAVETLMALTPAGVHLG